MLLRVPVKEARVRGPDYPAVPVVAEPANRLHIAFKVVVGTCQLEFTVMSVEIGAVDGDHSSGFGRAFQSLSIQDVVNAKMVFDPQLLLQPAAAVLSPRQVAREPCRGHH